MSDKRKGTFRFLTSLIPGALLLFSVIGVFSFIVETFDNGWGLLLAVIAVICLGFGGMTVYWNMVDWLNLKVIRRHAMGGGSIRQAEVAAFTGTVLSDEPPMESPFTKKPCAAYKYEISESRSSTTSGSKSRRVVLAEGFHMLPTRIEGPRGTFKLGAFPAVESELRSVEPSAWTKAGWEKIRQLVGNAPRGSTLEREAAFQNALHEINGAIHTDFCQTGYKDGTNTVQVEEEYVPINEEVSIVGTYDGTWNAITTAKRRFGPELMVYKGNPQEVLDRVGKEVRTFAKVAAVLLTIFTAIMAFTLLWQSST